MTQEIVELVRAMGRGGVDEALLQAVCRAVEQQLTARLRPGVTPGDCGGTFAVAAAWMALDALEAGGGTGTVESFSAGDLTIRTSSGGSSRGRREQVRRLMAPYCKEEGFAFQGVPG